MVQYDAFERVCEQLGITYTFPPEYYRRATRRWQAKKAFCIQVDFSTDWRPLGLHRRSFILCVSCQVHKEVQKQKAEQRKQMKQSLASTNTLNQ